MAASAAAIFPRPKTVSETDEQVTLGGELRLEAPSDWAKLLRPDLDALSKDLAPRWGEGVDLVIEQTSLDLPNPAQVYRLTVSADGVTLQAQSPEGARYGLHALAKIAVTCPIHGCTIEDWPDFPFRAVQFDLGRVIERPDVIERLIPIYSSANYNAIQLYFENAFHFASHPKLARDFAWTTDQSMQVVKSARQHGMAVIPAIQALGHCSWLTGHPDYAELDEGHAEGAHTGVLCPSNPRSITVLGDMIRDVAPLATSGIIHVGMDESFAIGRCPECAERRKSLGEGGIFAEHANRVAALVKAAGKQPAIWGDMFYYYPECVADLDKDIIIFDWFYYSFERWPRVELFNFEEMDTKSLWQEHGLKFWGCSSSVYSGIAPFNVPSDSIDNTRSWARYLEGAGDGILVTQWELAAASVDFAVPIDLACAGVLWGPHDQGDNDLFRSACGLLYNRPEVAELISEIARFSRHGHAARRLLSAATLMEMVTYSSDPGYLLIADRLEEIGDLLEAESAGAANSDMLEAFIQAAEWLAYQYRKLLLLDEAAGCVAAKSYSDAASIMARLDQDAETLSADWQMLWNRNRYPGDPAAVPASLSKETAMYSAELNALTAAIEGKKYKGSLDHPVIAVDIINTRPGGPGLEISTSEDGRKFTGRLKAHIIEFDSRSARPESDDEITYSVPVDGIEDARFIRVTAFGAGQFEVKSIRLHQGDQLWTPKSFEPMKLGDPEPKKLFYKLLSEGSGGRIWSYEHGSVTVEMENG